MTLKPCPFCGADDYLRIVYYDYDDDAIGWLTDKHPDDRDVREMAGDIMHCRVICMDCGGMMDALTILNLAEKWNRRVKE